VLAGGAPPQIGLDLVLDLLVLAVQFHVRVACRHTPRDAAKLRPHDLIVVGGTDLGLQLVELGGDRPIDKCDAQDHLESLLRKGLDLLGMGRIGDIEILDPAENADPVPAGREDIAMQTLDGSK